MTAPLCSACTKVPVTDSAYLCFGCTSILKARLDDAADYAGELEVTFARLAVGGGRVGGLSASTPLPWDERASRVARELHATLASWVRLVVEEWRPPSCEHMGPHRESGCTGCAPQWPADTAPAMAVWLVARLPWLRRHPAAAELLAEVKTLVNRARSVVHGPDVRLFAGPCLAEFHDAEHDVTWQCQDRLYADPGKPYVRCRACGTEWDVAARRAWMLAAAEDVLGYAAEITAALPGLGVERVTESMVRGWAFRGMLAAHGTDERGRPLYRTGDVIDLAVQAAARKARSEQRRSA